MLQRTQSAPAFDEAPQFATSSENLEYLLGFIRQQYPIVLFMIVLAVVVGAVYALTTPPFYTATATMLIDTRKVQPFPQQATLNELPIEVDSQVEILKSESIALSVLKNLQLTEDPEFVSWGDGPAGKLFASISNVFAFGEPPLQLDPTRIALRTFANRLNIKRVGLTYVISISYRSLNPDRAPQIANAVADAYIVDQLDAKYQATRRASAWLQDRLNELREQASTAERAVVDYKAKNNIIDAGGRLMTEQQLAELNSQAVISRAQAAEAKARLDRILAVLRADSPDVTVDATVADTLKNDVITKLRSRYLELATHEGDWSTRFGRNHLATVNLRNQMREINRSILDELHRIAETYKSDYEIAKQRVASVQAELAQVIAQSQVTNVAQIVLRDLESTAQIYRTLYDNFLQRHMESVQQQSFPVSEARVITKAMPPDSKSHPQTLLIIIACGFGGALVGAVIALLRDLSDRAFRSSDQVESLLHTDCIAVVPALKKKVKNVAIARQADITVPRPLTIPDGPMRAVVDDPFSHFAEAIRTIKLTADLRGSIKANKVIGFTSALPNEGKSTLSMATAQLIAQTGASVILVDCDLRRPTLTNALCPKAKSGLLHVISGIATIEDAVWTDPTTGLRFLPGATSKRVVQSNEIIASHAMKALLEKLRDSYDRIVVDFSPIAPVVDVRATMHLVDSYVLVIEWGRTNINVVQRSLNQAKGIYDNLLGAVLNKTDTALLARYEGTYAGYYYSKEYSPSARIG